MSVPLEHPPALSHRPPAAQQRNADLPPAPAPSLPREIASYAWRLVAVAAGLSAVVYGYQLLLSAPDAAGYPGTLRPYFPTRYFEYGAVFLTAATVFPRRREWAMAIVALPCLHNLWDTCPVLLPWIAVLVPTLYFLLGSEDRPGPVATRRFWWGVALGVFLGPKIVQVAFLHNAHDSFLDHNQTVFIGLFLRYAYYYYERRHALVPAGRFWEHVAYLLFVPQITGMLNVPPGEMSERWGFGAATIRRGFEAVGWAALKIPPVLWLERRVLPSWGYARGYHALHAAPFAVLWGCLLASYVYWALLVSAKFDLMIALFRFFGVNVEDNFRWPLLATSPVALWRRWNIYNRRLLLKFVYFPLGGNRDERLPQHPADLPGLGGAAAHGVFRLALVGGQPLPTARLAAVFRRSGHDGLRGLLVAPASVLGAAADKCSRPVARARLGVHAGQQRVAAPPAAGGGRVSQRAKPAYRGVLAASGPAGPGVGLAVAPAP